MKLYKLINGIAETALEDMEISGITDNTSKVREGFIFVCVRGASFCLLYTSPSPRDS